MVYPCGPRLRSKWSKNPQPKTRLYDSGRAVPSGLLAGMPGSVWVPADGGQYARVRRGSILKPPVYLWQGAFPGLDTVTEAQGSYARYYPQQEPASGRRALWLRARCTAGGKILCSGS